MNKTIQLAAALLLGLAGPAMAEDIKVGAIFPLSGGAGPDGQSIMNAIKLEVDQINAKGGLLGRKLTVISKDDESTPAVGVSRPPRGHRSFQSGVSGGAWTPSRWAITWRWASPVAADASPSGWPSWLLRTPTFRSTHPVNGPTARRR